MHDCLGENTQILSLDVIFMELSHLYHKPPGLDHIVLVQIIKLDKSYENLNKVVRQLKPLQYPK